MSTPAKVMLSAPHLVEHRALQLKREVAVEAGVVAVVVDNAMDRRDVLVSRRRPMPPRRRPIQERRCPSPAAALAPRRTGCQIGATSKSKPRPSA